MALVTISDPRSPASEAYRSLRTNLSFYSLDAPLRTLVVTSPAAGEGKSSTVANLAVTMAQSGRRTVLVDCDLRRPTLHELFGLAMTPGLTSLALDETVAVSYTHLDVYKRQTAAAAGGAARRRC